MANRQTLLLQEFFAAVNRDIRRELRFADECMQQVGLLHRGELLFVGAQFLRCAATAMCNATALAAEVLATGGTPPAGPQCRHDLVPYWPELQRETARLAQAVQHYWHRWRVAQKLGLFRFAEVFLEIVRTKRSQLNDILLLAGSGGTTDLLASKSGCAGRFRIRGSG
ncbi:MAG: hypothetical protein ABSH05_06965 [Bryobacteraceae bacterium]|jgi:hypothetical protein